MGIFSKHLLLSDMDGTFLDELSQMHPRNLAGAAHFMKETGVFAMATGRTRFAAAPYFQSFATNSPTLLYNGGMIYDFALEKIIHLETLPKQAIDYVKTVMAAVSDIGVIVATVEGDFCVSDKGQAGWFNALEKSRIPVAGDIDTISKQWMKVIFVAGDQAQQEVMATCTQFKDVSFIQSSKIFYEMIPKGTSKGSSLLILADYLKIPYANTYAIGDFNNDIAMVCVAEIGAMPSNAPKEIQHYADVIVCPNTEGCVGDFVDYLDRLKRE